LKGSRAGLGILALAVALVVWRIATQSSGSGAGAQAALVRIDFESDVLSRFTSLAQGAARVQGGVLQVQGLMNRPLWLQQPLPHDVRVKVKARGMGPEGDVKVELFGDGKSGFVGDPRAAYTATGYIVVMGGWHNTISAIAKQHEHGHDRAERSDFRVEPGRWYEWVIERRGGRLTWTIDGLAFLELDDPAPLYDDEHRFFAFSDWTSPVEFDDLVIEPL
jgi:hypothetical protein